MLLASGQGDELDRPGWSGHVRRIPIILDSLDHSLVIQGVLDHGHHSLVSNGLAWRDDSLVSCQGPYH
jgi:hypothetical protein